MMLLEACFTVLLLRFSPLCDISSFFLIAVQASLYLLAESKRSI